MASPQTQFLGLQNARMDMAGCTRDPSVDTTPVTDRETLEWSQLPCCHAARSQKESTFPVQLKLVAMETKVLFLPSSHIPTTGVGFSTNIRNWSICFLGLPSPGVPLDVFPHAYEKDYTACVSGKVRSLELESRPPHGRQAEFR